MFSFTTAFFATLVTGATASLPPLAGYEPQTNVADHAAIAYDQQYIEDQVGFGNADGFDKASKVYSQGGNSKSVAMLTLTQPLTESLAKGTSLDIAGTYNGKAYKTYAATSTVIGFQYDITEIYADNVDCKIGGLYGEARVETGCIEGGTGTISIAGGREIDYMDYVIDNNENERTIQGFSTSANEKFRPNKDLNEDFFSFYKPVVEYYGQADFSDQIVTAGLEGTNTDLTNGNVNLVGYDFSGRAQIVKKVTAYVSIAFYVLYELWDATEDCKKSCASGNCNDDSVDALDEGVAFYVGGSYPADEKGNLFYALAQKRAANFNTVEADGVSSVNRRVMTNFNKMKTELNAGSCDESVATAVTIADLIKIPAIQGTLRYAYVQTTKDDPSQKEMAEGVAFAAGVLPFVHECNPADAKIIHDNISLKANLISTVTYAEVKKAFEDNYDCMGITCADVGGLYDDDNKCYLAGAAPCGDASAVTCGAPTPPTPTPPTPTPPTPTPPAPTASTSAASGSNAMGGFVVLFAATMSFFM